MGWKVVGEYLDQVSGRKAERPQFQAAMKDARKRKFDVLLFWSLDRLSREGVLKTLLILHQLSGYGVKYRPGELQGSRFHAPPAPLGGTGISIPADLASARISASEISSDAS
jgi:DNA invertase Pin-like site-specific DNA recombinase